MILRTKLIQLKLSLDHATTVTMDLEILRLMFLNIELWKLSSTRTEDVQMSSMASKESGLLRWLNLEDKLLFIYNDFFIT